MASYNDTLERDLSSLRNQMTELTARLDSGADLNVKNTSAKNRAEIEIVDLKGNFTIKGIRLALA